VVPAVGPARQREVRTNQRIAVVHEAKTLLDEMTLDEMTLAEAIGRRAGLDRETTPMRERSRH